jgi:hypothetical protein
LTAHRLVAFVTLLLIPTGLPELDTSRATVAICLERSRSSRPWDATFLHDLPRFQRQSVKQQYVVKEIADHVLKRGTA